MIKTKRQDGLAELPEPITLTAEQLKEVATKTAGAGCTVPVTLPSIIAGGIRVAQ
jgi:hypothetical protein